MDLTPGPGEDRERSDVEQCQAAATANCEHVYATRIRGGEPIAVPSCMLCDEINWGDLREQVEEIREAAYRAGLQAANNAITWDTTCLNCSALLDIGIREREAGYRAGREDAARDIRPVARRLVARIIANARLLDVPFTDASDQSPWTRMKPAMYALFDAVGIKFAEVNQPRTVEATETTDTESSPEVERADG